jgi:hypothetical protein
MVAWTLDQDEDRYALPFVKAPQAISTDYSI